MQKPVLIDHHILLEEYVGLPEKEAERQLSLKSKTS